jgi:hypothetical protein
MKYAVKWTGRNYHPIIRSISDFRKESGKITDYRARAVYSMNCLRLIERWDRGFESHQGMDISIVCIYSLFVLFCV